MESCKHLKYILLRPNGFRIYTDHRNYLCMFDPTAFDSNMAKYQIDNLQRWAMVLSMFRYTIEHIPGDDNVWGDLLSQRGFVELIPSQTASADTVAFALMD